MNSFGWNRFVLPADDGREVGGGSPALTGLRAPGPGWLVGQHRQHPVSSRASPRGTGERAGEGAASPCIRRPGCPPPRSGQTPAGSILLLPAPQGTWCCRQREGGGSHLPVVERLVQPRNMALCAAFSSAWRPEHTPRQSSISGLFILRQIESPAPVTVFL